MPTLDLTANIIDVRDIIARYEELESESDGLPNAFERYQLTLILDDIKGNGGDEQWRSDWYPVTLIRDSYFTEYARELLQDCDAIPNTLPGYVVIDWEATADNIKSDYMCIDIGGTDYWYRRDMKNPRHRS